MYKKYSFFEMTGRLIKNLNMRNKKIYFYCIAYTITAGIFPLFGVYLPKLLLTAIITENIDLSYIYSIIIIYFCVAGIVVFIENYTLYASKPLIMDLRINLLAKLLDKIATMDYKNIEDPTFNDRNELALRACDSNTNGVEYVYTILFNIFGKLLGIILFIILICMLNAWILAAIIISTIIGYLMGYFGNKIHYKHKEVLARANRKREYYNHATHDFTYGKDIRLYELQDKVMDKYRLESCNYVNLFRKIKNKQYALGLIELFGILLSDIIMYGILIWEVINGLSIADFTMYLSAAIVLSTSLKIVAKDITSTIHEGAYVNDFFKFLDKNNNENNGVLPAIPNCETLKIEFRNVSFKYPNTEKYIFKNLNLVIKKGEKLAIVGINGAGKTTFVKLLTRLFEIEEGEIFINDIPVKQFSLTEYYKMFSVVFQNINIMAITLKENIALTNSNVDDDKIYEAIEKVGLTEKVASLANGIEHMLLKIIDENGAVFSGGENQKLAIARAIFKDANAVILDEPTASLDALAEAEIYENFNKLVKNKTVIFISHRLASTRFCDKIALFNETGLIEYGNHDELMKLNGEYYNMFVTQGKYYQNNGDIYE